MALNQPEMEWLAVEIDLGCFSVQRQDEAGFDTSPRILQRYHQPTRVESEWFDFELAQSRLMQGRVRLCPYFFAEGEFEKAKAKLGGVLATIHPADKKTSTA